MTLVSVSQDFNIPDQLTLPPMEGGGYSYPFIYVKGNWEVRNFTAYTAMERTLNPIAVVDAQSIIYKYKADFLPGQAIYFRVIDRINWKRVLLFRGLPEDLIIVHTCTNGSINTDKAIAVSGTATIEVILENFSDKYNVYIYENSVLTTTLSISNLQFNTSTLVGIGLGNSLSGYSPYIDNVSLTTFNSIPNVPTDLTKTSVNWDATPIFTASISDPDKQQQIKCRFEIFQSDGSTHVGTVDSLFKSGSHIATAEYNSDLPNGDYLVRAKTIDDKALSSAYTAWVAFKITSIVTLPNLELLWDVKPYVLIELELLWSIREDNQVDLELLWNVNEIIAKDVVLLWHQNTPWAELLDIPDEIWSEVFLREVVSGVVDEPSSSGTVTETVEATV